MGEQKFPTEPSPILATIGGLLLAVGPMWQIYKSYKNRRTKDLAFGWLIFHMSGLILMVQYAIIDEIWPILPGDVIELTCVFILLVFKIWLEKRFLCWDWDNDPPDILNMSTANFQKIHAKDKISLRILADKLDDFLEKSNDDEDYFQLDITRKELEKMLDDVVKYRDPPKNNSQTKLDIVV